MDELRKVALAYWKVASDDIREEAQTFFNKMDSNRDRRVSLHEYLSFMDEEQYREFKRESMFNRLLNKGKKYLEFYDVLALYYIIKSGRPFCEGCNRFIKGTYFCCVKCFNRSKGNYCLCTECFQDRKYKDPSGHHHQFLDNFTFLQKMRDKADAVKKQDADAVKKAHASTSRQDSSRAVVLHKPVTGQEKKGKAVAKAAIKVVVFVANVIGCSVQ